MSVNVDNRVSTLSLCVVYNKKIKNSRCEILKKMMDQRGEIAKVGKGLIGPRRASGPN